MLAFNAYSEGWALYAEQLADELGVYDDFPVGPPRLSPVIAFRACRLVVDTGLHAKRWTREQGVDFFVDENGSKPEEVAQRSRPLLQLAGPGLRLQGRPQRDQPPARQAPRRRSGRSFDLKAFDDAVVLGGNVPMDVLAKNVDDYIRSAKAQSSALRRQPAAAGIGPSAAIDRARSSFASSRRRPCIRGLDAITMPDRPASTGAS